MPSAFSMNSYQGKQILALVRDGDYAHAGEEEAIERTLSALPKNPARHILDAGCGRGGTAAYMQSHGWGRVTGVDIEPKSIDYAHHTFPDVAFHCCDIHDASVHVPSHFDAVTMFNVLYAVSAQSSALLTLAGRGKAGATLVLFDYVDLGGYRDTPIEDAGKPFLPHPPMRDDLERLLREGGWQLQSVDDLTADYARWYAALVEKIEAKRAAIEALAGPDAYEHVLSRYTGLLTAIREGRLGGAVIYGNKLSPAA
jgi:cyclopropane fatty-acyl-phospholipid synthase-like methyltransferase